jgi:hypothetical protein
VCLAQEFVIWLLASPASLKILTYQKNRERNFQKNILVLFYSFIQENKM